MFVDYLTIMLADLAAALFLFALYMVFFFEKDSKKVVPGFLLTGGLGLVTGLAMILTWPLPGSSNILFGEPMVLLGAVFFVAGLCLQYGWNLLTVGIFAVGAGAVAILLGLKILAANLTKEPLIAGIGYILAGAAAVLSLPAIGFPKMKWIRWVAAAVAVVAAGIWVFTAFSSYWAHIDSFSSWKPDSMLARTPPAPAK
jgi:putative membrane protein